MTGDAVEEETRILSEQLHKVIIGRTKLAATMALITVMQHILSEWHEDCRLEILGVVIKSLKSVVLRHKV